MSQDVNRAGTPLTSIGLPQNGGLPGAGDICQNVYVFDSNQEMIACCACRLTPNELSSAAVGAQLTNHALTGTAPVSGVVKIAFTIPNAANGPSGCRAETAVLAAGAANASWAVMFGTHLQAEPPASPTSLFVTETSKLPQFLSDAEALFLPNACSMLRYLGSGLPGTCSCNAGVGAIQLLPANLPDSQLMVLRDNWHKPVVTHFVFRERAICRRGIPLARLPAGQRW